MWFTSMWNQRLPHWGLPRHTLRPPPHTPLAPGCPGHCLSRVPPQWAQSPGQSAAFSLMSSPPLVKGLLQKASFEMRIQVDRKGQESSHTCSNDRQVFWLCLLHAASPEGCCGCEPLRLLAAHENWVAEKAVCWFPQEATLWVTGAGLCFLHTHKAKADFQILGSQKFGKITLE